MPAMERPSPDSFLAPFPDPIRDAANRLREIVLWTVPGAIEAVRPGWHVIGYSVPLGRRTRYFGFVAPDHLHVHLGLEYGALIDDPDGELGGTDLRQVRFLTFHHPDEVRERQVGRFIRDAARLAAMSRAQRRALRFDRDDLMAMVRDSEISRAL
jgi:hypothetical protein